MNLSTVQKWGKELDKLDEWLRYEEAGGKVNLIYCAMCRKHADRLKAVRNFSPGFIDGVTGTSLKKDNVSKHSTSNMHTKAMDMEQRPSQTLSGIMKTTPLGKAFASASSEEIRRIGKLFEISYVLAKEELPFRKYPAIVELEKRHGVPLGNTYGTEHKCQEFTNIIAEGMKDDALEEIKSARYLSVLLDGSTDSSVLEKELMYVMYMGADGSRKCHFFCLANVGDATSPGIQALLKEKFAETGIDLQAKLVSICVDGAAVNLGVRRGLAALLRKDMPWLVAIHCFNHRLELAAKDACSSSYLEEISTMLLNLHYTYEKSPKRLRELKELADAMDESIRKPDKASGTRWLQHKSRALSSLLLSYPVLVAHLKSMSSADSTAKAIDKIRFGGYLKQLTSFKFVLNMLFFEALLNPLAGFSCSLQADSIDLSISVAKFKALLAALETLKDDSDKSTELSKFLAGINLANETVEYRGVKLSAFREDVLNNFANTRKKYVKEISECLANRFNDLVSSSVMKGATLLDVSAWSSEESNNLDTFGCEELSGLIDHFRVLLEKSRVNVAAIVTEWHAFKQYWAQTAHQTGKKVWSLLMTYHRSQFPNLAHLVEVLLLFPVSNAKVERGFSSMKRIKTDWRSRLGEATLDSLMRISVDGPAPCDFEPTSSVQRFFATPRHTGVQPYGPRKRSHAESEQQ